jgi:hypothetical protein
MYFALQNVIFQQCNIITEYIHLDNIYIYVFSRYIYILYIKNIYICFISFVTTPLKKREIIIPPITIIINSNELHDTWVKSMLISIYF